MAESSSESTNLLELYKRPGINRLSGFCEHAQQLDVDDLISGYRSLHHGAMLTASSPSSGTPVNPAAVLVPTRKGARYHFDKMYPAPLFRNMSTRQRLRYNIALIAIIANTEGFS